MAFDLNDYVDVATRLTRAHERWPELRIEEHLPVIVTVGDRTFIQCTVTVHRDPADQLPTTASVWEPWPGQTPYSKNSEVMVGNTSALGRALAYMGLEVRKGIASRDEVAARRSQPTEQPVDEPASKTRLDGSNLTAPSAKQLAKLNLLLGQFGLDTRDEKLVYVAGIIGRDVNTSKEMTPIECGRVIDALTEAIANTQKG